MGIKGKTTVSVVSCRKVEKKLQMSFEFNLNPLGLIGDMSVLTETNGGKYRMVSPEISLYTCIRYQGPKLLTHKEPSQ